MYGGFLLSEFQQGFQPALPVAMTWQKLKTQENGL
jgi:hypothetical protein